MRKLKCHRGSASILFIGITFALLCLTFLLLELGSVMERYDYALDVLQRSVNSAVEKNMLDEYRSDRILKMDPAEAEKDFRTFAAADMPDGYEVHIQSVSAKASPPEMEARGTLTIPTLFSQYGIRETTYSFIPVFFGSVKAAPKLFLNCRSSRPNCLSAFRRCAPSVPMNTIRQPA